MKIVLFLFFSILFFEASSQREGNIYYKDIDIGFPSESQFLDSKQNDLIADLDSKERVVVNQPRISRCFSHEEY